MKNRELKSIPDLFCQWLSSPIGQRLLAEEQSRLEVAARRFHGDAMLWVGPVCHPADCTERSMVRSRVYVPTQRAVADARPGSQDAAELVPWLRADLNELPLRTGSITAVVLHHALDLVDEPRHALREVVRVLADGGRLVVCGFNPYSLWGLRRLYAAVRDDAFSDLAFVAPNRLHDWLTVLGMDAPRLVPTCLNRPPLSFARFDGPRLQALSRRLDLLPIGGSYLMTAMKSSSAGQPPWSERVRASLGKRPAAPAPVTRLSTSNTVRR
ncbi:MAG: class I SAM-dependent methyltransferase [Pseudomonadaceae bacterium]|nr:class I SAM-dependent methyltransferase [Pseudomonadaceae bacterium]